MGLFNFFRKNYLPKVSCEEGRIANALRPGEGLLAFHQRIYAQYADRKAPAVEMLRNELADSVKDEIRAAIAADPSHWAAPYHFFWGMGIRNLLREKGFGEDYWPIWNLDDIYVMLVEDAVRQ
jgi:hypothetical protein